MVAARFITNNLSFHDIIQQKTVPRLKTIATKTLIEATATVSKNTTIAAAATVAKTTTIGTIARVANNIVVASKYNS